MRDSALFHDAQPHLAGADQVSSPVGLCVLWGRRNSRRSIPWRFSNARTCFSESPAWRAISLVLPRYRRSCATRYSCSKLARKRRRTACRGALRSSAVRLPARRPIRRTGGGSRWGTTSLPVSAPLDLSAQTRRRRGRPLVTLMPPLTDGTHGTSGSANRSREGDASRRDLRRRLRFGYDLGASEALDCNRRTACDGASAQRGRAPRMPEVHPRGVPGSEPSRSAWAAPLQGGGSSG